jgi:hypothetical protein
MSAGKDTMASQSPKSNISDNNSDNSNFAAHVLLMQCERFGAKRVQPKASTAQHSTHGTHHLNAPAAVVARLGSQLLHLPVLVSSPSHLPQGVSLMPLPPAGVHPLTWWGPPNQPGGHCPLLQALSLQNNLLVKGHGLWS